MSTLVTTVHVADKNGDNHIFGPGDNVPKWAKEKITNPKAWAEETDEDAAAKAAEEKAEAEAKAAQEAADEAEKQAAEAKAAAAGNSPLPIPAKGGPKATAEAWAAYAVQEITARGLNIEIPADATRTDIIEALQGAGIPTEE